MCETDSCGTCQAKIRPGPPRSLPASSFDLRLRHVRVSDTLNPTTEHPTMSEEQNVTNGTDGAREVDGSSPKPSSVHSKSGWDGKLRVNKQATLANPEALSDPDYSDEDAPPPEQIEADEGMVHQSSTTTDWRLIQHDRST
jgi:hypothetical protein